MVLRINNCKKPSSKIKLIVNAMGFHFWFAQYMRVAFAKASLCNVNHQPSVWRVLYHYQFIRCTFTQRCKWASSLYPESCHPQSHVHTHTHTHRSFAYNLSGSAVIKFDK